MKSSIDFAIGPEATPAQAIERIAAMVKMTVPQLQGEMPGADLVHADVQAVLTELVDVTARHQASMDLLGKVTIDGKHVTMSVGDVNCPLPAPEEEPGLLVHRVASEVGQHAGDNGGRVAVAAVAVTT